MGKSRINGLALINILLNNCMGRIDPIIILKCFDQTGHLQIGHVFFESDTERSA